MTQARYNSLGIEVVPLDAAFGVEVRGVDLWRSPSPRLVSELRALWSEHGIIAFRRQAVSEEELCRFSAEFGDVVPHVRTDWSSKAAREITLVSNMRNALGQGIGGLGAGEIAWHTDQSFVARPATGCLLYAVELPPDNPDTSWANLMLAFEAMPAAMRRAVEGRTAEFSYARRVSGYEAGNEPPAAIAAKVPPVRHGLVQVHPVSGRKALYLDPGTMTGVTGMSEGEGRTLLEEVTRFATASRFVYRHRWQIGDVVMWDNGFLLHRREGFDTVGSRLMKRTIIRLPPSAHICPVAVS